MDEFQFKTYELLKIFVEFCNKHDIKYFLIGGTCLGAVRHKGYIPWDDDIDVGLPRDDFDRFVRLAKEEFKGDIFFQSFETDKNFMFNFVKLKNGNTTFIEQTYKFCDMNHGLWLDIFPLDGVKTNKKGELTWIHTKGKIALIWALWLPVYARTQLRRIRKNHFFEDLFLDMVFGPLSLLNTNNICLKINEKIMKRHNYKDCDYIANLQGAWKSKEICRKDFFNDGVLMQFEDIECRIPEKYDAYLTKLYGDYMTPPPENKRASHHNVVYCDLNKSYKEFHENYRVWKE